MRALFLLHGAPGTGKSTLVQKLSVEELTLGYDIFRELFSAQFPCADLPDGTASATLRLTSDAERAAVNAAHEALKARLAAGTTVFWDTTSSRVKDQTQIAKLAASYGYTTYLIDCQGGISFEELAVRNERRGVKRVDEQALRQIHERCAANPVSPMVAAVLDGTDRWAMEHLAQNIREITAVPTIDVAALGFDHAVVVGDVHNCASGLQQIVDELDTERTYWVFAGDLFDRGPDPVGVWNLVASLIGERRAVVVTGNHEVNLRAINSQTATAPFRDTRETRDALLAAGIMADEQNAFVNRTVPALLIEGLGTNIPWLVTHGGIGQYTLSKIEDSGLLHVSDAECIYGLADRAHAYRAKTSYNVADMPLAGSQLHGHRNSRAGEELAPLVRDDSDGDPIVCLETGASTGGKISAAFLGPAGFYSIHQADDGVDAATAARNGLLPWQRAKQKPADPQDASQLLARMRSSEHVNVRAVEGLRDVVACNFTRKAFHQGAWDELTMHARGLFIDESTGRIVARGYEKFFHLDEAPGRTKDQWLRASATSYPVAVRKKYNGYLALVSSVDGELAVFSKSGITDYSRFAEKLLHEQLARTGVEQAGALMAQMLERTGCTAAFEVIAASDTHPIQEQGEDRLVLLDCIRNQATFSTDENIRQGLSRRFGFDVAETEVIARDPLHLMNALVQATVREDEGVVLIDSKGYRSKVKADMYSERKSARGALERVWRGRADTLGPRFKELEDQLRRAGIFRHLVEATDYTVISAVDQNPRLDLAAVFDDLEAYLQGVGSD